MPRHHRARVGEQRAVLGLDDRSPPAAGPGTRDRGRRAAPRAGRRGRRRRARSRSARRASRGRRAVARRSPSAGSSDRVEGELRRLRRLAARLSRLCVRHTRVTRDSGSLEQSLEPARVGSQMRLPIEAAGGEDVGWTRGSSCRVVERDPWRAGRAAT